MYRLAFLARLNRFGRLAPRPIHYAPGFPERLWLNFLARSIASRDHCRVDTTFEEGKKRAACFLFGGGIIKKKKDRATLLATRRSRCNRDERYAITGWCLIAQRTIGLQQGTVQTLQGEQETSPDPEPPLTIK